MEDGGREVAAWCGEALLVRQMDGVGGWQEGAVRVTLEGGAREKRWKVRRMVGEGEKPTG